jgi:hypothetical protein
MMMMIIIIIMMMMVVMVVTRAGKGGHHAPLQTYGGQEVVHMCGLAEDVLRSLRVYFR